MPRLTRRQRDQRDWDRWSTAADPVWTCAKDCGAGSPEQDRPEKCWLCGSPVVPAEKRATRAGSK